MVGVIGEYVEDFEGGWFEMDCELCNGGWFFFDEFLFDVEEFLDFVFFVG